MTGLPDVDVIVPARHASESIGDAIDAVRNQSYPGLGKIVVAAYDEDTAAVARAHGAEVIDNPSGITPTGLNLALACTAAEVVARVDAHSIIPPGYLERAIGTLVETGADNVGGMQVPRGTTFIERAIAAAMSSPLGAGDARYRVGGKPGPVETVYLGVFRRSTLLRLGGFDESFERNQDYELNHRIRTGGGLVWFDPELKVEYRPRGSIGALARQYLDYGRGKRRFARKHPGSLRLRQLAPPALVIGLILSLVGALVAPWLLALPALYLLGLAIGAIAESSRCGAPALALPLIWPVMHLSWGLGFLAAR